LGTFVPNSQTKITLHTRSVGKVTRVLRTTKQTHHKKNHNPLWKLSGQGEKKTVLTKKIIKPDA
jgi:hypothetical protein